MRGRRCGLSKACEMGAGHLTACHCVLLQADGNYQCFARFISTYSALHFLTSFVTLEARHGAASPALVQMQRNRGKVQAYTSTRCPYRVTVEGRCSVHVDGQRATGLALSNGACPTQTQLCRSIKRCELNLERHASANTPLLSVESSSRLVQTRGK